MIIFCSILTVMTTAIKAVHIFVLVLLWFSYNDAHGPAAGNSRPSCHRSVNCLY